MNTFGNRIKLSIFGESHGPAVGCVFDGLPAGLKIDFDLVSTELNRRKPRNTQESTKRLETDDYSIISGVYNGRTTGAPISVVFENRDAVSKDYDAIPPRPSHADLAASIKFQGYNDPRGGGHFSGRLTLPLVFIGAIVKQLLFERGIDIVSHIASVGTISDISFDKCMKSVPLLDPFFPLLDTSKRHDIEALFDDLRRSGDSVGASCECIALGLPVGLGEPFFYGIESVVSQIVFSIPGVHAVEFGSGFDMTKMRGSEANDAIIGTDKTMTNNSGGINGGLSNGMPIIMRAAFRPVPSIAREQISFDPKTNETTRFTLHGRHDVCILPRGLVAVEAALAIGLYDLLLLKEN